MATLGSSSGGTRRGAEDEELSATGAAGAGSAACTLRCQSQPRSLWQLPAPCRPKQDPALKPGKPSGIHKRFLGDGGVQPKQVGPSGQEGQVTAVLPHSPFSFSILRAWYIL